MNLGQAVKRVRKNKGLNQEQFCNKIGITQSFLSGIENNKKKPSIDVIQKIAEVVDMPLPVLFWFTITEKDVHQTKLDAFKLLKPTVDKVVTDLFN